MVPVLAARIPDAFAPKAGHRCRTVGSSDASVGQNDFVAIDGIAAISPSITFATADLCRAIFQQMPMICSDDDNASRCLGFIKNGQNQAQIFQGPALIQLVRATQMVVDRVVNQPNDALMRVGDRRANLA